MNEQQLQQILTIQQAIAAAATAAVINSLLNPQQQQQQQAAGLATANALTDPSNDLQQQLQQLQQLHQHQQQQQHHHHQQQQQQQHHQQQQQENRHSPANSPNSNQVECNNRIQDLLMQLQQQAAVGQSPLALNSLNLSTQQSTAAAAAIAAAAAGGNNNPFSSSPLSSRSPVGAGAPTRLTAQELNATTSNTQQQSNHHQASPIKKLKRHHHLQQQPFNNRSSEATSKPQHNSTPKNHSTIANLSRNSGNTGANNNSSSSSSSAFIANNVGLPRKLVRGQDVWLGRGAEQTRQILKCMWCGQSFRTLAEMTQHMKITQHYTNIMSQEQITSWRQPENSDATNHSKHGKQATAQVRNLEDNRDDLSDKFNDSDREESFSNDDESDQHSKQPQQRLGHHQQSSRLLEQHNKRDLSLDNASESNLDDSFRAAKGSPNSKPLTRSKRRENETLPIKREVSGREGSPASSSPSQQQRQSSASNLILGESNEDSETNKEFKTNGSPIESSADRKTSPALSTSKTPTSEDGENQNTVEPEYEDDGGTGSKREAENNEPNEDDDDDDGIDADAGGASEGNDGDDGDAGDRSGYDEDDDDASQKRRRKCGDSTGSEANDDRKLKDLTNEEGELIGDDPMEEDDEVGDNDDEQRSETNESSTTTTSGAKQSAAVVSGGQKGGETGDPLSALETMVEKSFDPRLRPGVANGGILQRLGIDEEVCPPWQHINYANWYAAAAYGHPMAAALLAAGINLQNGIKLSKNVGPKKNED